MRKLLSFLFFSLLTLLTYAGQDMKIYDLIPGHTYYIYNVFYQRALAYEAKTDGTYQPRLVAYSAAKDKQFQWTAEAGSAPGYVRLKNVATGRYMHASSSNAYSVDMQATATTDKRFDWECRPGHFGGIINRQSTTTSLGVDTGDGSKEYIGVWYDKNPSSSSSSCTWQMAEVSEGGPEASVRIWAKTHLANLIDLCEQEIQNTKNNSTMVRIYTNTRIPAMKACLANDALTTDSIYNFCDVEYQRSYNLYGAERQNVLPSTEMESMSSIFSLGINPFSFTATAIAENDSVRMIIRSPSLRGAELIIKPTSIRSMETTIPLTLGAESNAMAFVYKDAKIHVYVDAQKVGELPTCFVPVRSEQGEAAEWSIIRKSRLANSVPELLSSNKEVITSDTEGHEDEYGKMVRSVVSLNKQNMTIDKQLDLHLLADENVLSGCVVNLAHPDAWLIFDNVIPSEVKEKYLSQIRINGSRATEGSNCRIAIYLAGAAVIPVKSSDKPFVGYDGEMYAGESLSLGAGKHTNLGANANRTRSFTLKRGYMAVLASGTNGSGYSRVYVADHHDIQVEVLPDALYGRISSVTIRPWQYISKKGWCSTQGTSAIASEAKKLHATWFYTWGADRSSTSDLQYVPIRQHRYWPSMSAISAVESTACLSINEPDHSEQHNNCDCGGVLSTWTCCTLVPDFQQTGMRIGGPAPTAEGWNQEFIGHCNDMAYRCDFIAIHCYWGSNEANDGNAWYNKLKAIYDQTKRPIWITEWAYGASWTKESWPSGWSEKLEQNRWRVKDIQKKLEEAPFVERYAYYQWDTQFRNLVDWSSGYVTPAGRVYRDMKSTFAYNAKVQFTPVWWTPGLKAVSMTAEINQADMTLAVTCQNPNQDLTDKFIIQYLNPETNQWEDIYTETNRSKFDQDEIKLTIPATDINVQDGKLRLYVKRRQGDESISVPTIIFSEYRKDVSDQIKNADCTDGTKNWSVTNVETANAESFDGSSSNWYFNIWKSGGYTSTMSQTLTSLPEGRYTLGALLRGGTNANIKLQAVVESTDPERATTVEATITPTGNTSAATDPYKNGWKQATCAPVVIGQGDKLTVKLTSVLPAAGWWSADHFTLIWESLEDPTSIDNISGDQTSVPSTIYDLSGRRIPQTTRGFQIVNGKKVIK